MSQGARAGEVIAVESKISAIVDDTLAYRGLPIESLRTPEPSLAVSPSGGGA